MADFSAILLIEMWSMSLQNTLYEKFDNISISVGHENGYVSKEDWWMNDGAAKQISYRLLHGLHKYNDKNKITKGLLYV